MKNVILVTLLSLSFSLAAQEYAFKVLVNKGKNEVRASGGWQQIKVGSSLKSIDEIRIAENSYLGLVHVSGKPLELKQSGNYKMTDLATKINGGVSVLNKYTDFILSENTEKKNSLVATGAVHRGLGIKVYLPDPGQQSVVYGDIISITWDTSKYPGPYVVTFKSIFGDDLSVMETKEGGITVDLYDEKFKNEDNILVQVTPKKGDASTPDSYSLKKLSVADKDRIKQSLHEIERPLADSTALNRFVLAGFYEENNLLIDAATAYQEAIRMAPDVTFYQDAFNTFLIRTGWKSGK